MECVCDAGVLSTCFSPGPLDAPWTRAVGGTHRELKGLNRKVHGHPPGQPGFQRMDPGDSLALELKRHPGACGFVGSGAVEH